jgi:integrase
VGALNKAVRWGLVARNVAALVDGPRIPHHEIGPLTPEEARALLEAARGHRMEALYSVAIAIGLRQGEALGLTWQDVDLEAGVLHVRRALSRVEGEYRLVETKTARSRRTLALPTVALVALREHRQRQRIERVAAGKRWDGRWGLVFCTRSGRPLHGPSVTQEFQELLARVGLPRQRFHDLRHACASLLLAQGVELKVIQELLGHSAIAVTANTYAHVMGELKRDAAARMDAVFRPGSEASR